MKVMTIDDFLEDYNIQIEVMKRCYAKIVQCLSTIKTVHNRLPGEDSWELEESAIYDLNQVENMLKRLIDTNDSTNFVKL